MKLNEVSFYVSFCAPSEGIKKRYFPNFKLTSLTSR